MTQEEAADLIRKGVDRRSSHPQSWADVGCGTGTFTTALASLLPPGSTIDALDIDRDSLLHIPSAIGDVEIKIQCTDYLNAHLPKEMDGILLGNFLHFIPDKVAVLSQMFEQLHPSGRIVLIEYDTDKPNPWVPYPVSFDKLAALAGSVGFQAVEKLSLKPSLYQRSGLYSAKISR